MKVLVIGAGVLGLMSAWRLAAAGHEVSVYEKSGHFAEASSRSFAWINANNKSPAHYNVLNQLGIQAHLEMVDEIPDAENWVHQTGCIMIDFSEGAPSTYAARVASSQATDYPVENISGSKLVELEPRLGSHEFAEGALLFSSEGYLDNDLLGEFLVARLTTLGVPTHVAEVESVSSTPTGVEVSSTLGKSSFDAVVLAAGAASGALAERSGYDVQMFRTDVPSPATHSFLGLTRPVAEPVRHVIISDKINVRPRHDGRMYVQVPELEPLVADAHDTSVMKRVHAEMEQRLQEIFGDDCVFDSVIASARSLPKDGLPIVGYIDQHRKVYAQVMHSGMTLSALMSKLCVDELEGNESELLKPFRPDRFNDTDTAVGDPVFNQYFIGKQ